MADEDLVLVTIDGKSHDARAPFLHVDDLAVLRGDGVFETVLVRNGEACTIELHLERLRRNAEALELPEPDRNEWRAAVDEAVQQWGSVREGVLRLVHSRGREPDLELGLGKATSFISIGPVPERVRTARAEGVAVVTLQRGLSVDLAADAPWLMLGTKTLSYAGNTAARRFARRMGADDAIFLSTEGRVLEATGAAVLVVRDGKLVTPPHKHGIVPSTTQQALFEVAERAGYKCEYQPLFAADLIMADGLWLLSSVTVATRVTKLDGLTMFEPEIAPKITQLADEAVRRIGTLVR
jgi:4-amino-4-deoxychorismate lyase